MELPIITAAGGLVQNSNGEFLLMYRRGFWDLPKGKLDAGESIPDCAIREVQEETGLQSLELGPFICTTTHPYFDTWLNKDVVKHTHWFSMLSLANDTLVPQTEEDIEKLVWATVPELPEYLNNTYPTIRAVFEAFNAGTPKS
ncbi:MAG: NUDIX hydrolase [Bacteroidota bacterium]|jgi:8-oxo-dGTP pyrophosphatase MutT (NUDIX family)